MRRSTHILLGFVACLLLGACFDSQTLSDDLAKTLSFEAYQSASNINAIIIESNQYPCNPASQCPPTISKNAQMSVMIDGGPPELLICDGGIFQQNDIQTAAGQEVTIQIETPEKIYKATSSRPDSTEIIIAAEYQLNTGNLGLYLRLDTNALLTSNGIFVQVYTDRFFPRYGFLITSDRTASSRLPNNGFYQTAEVFYIPHSEIMETQVPLFQDDIYFISVRNITLESAEFYDRFKKVLAEGNVNLNNGLFFAPPENLPTNFDNGGFGFFHLFYERVIQGVVQ
jgi:hypothetical protein